MKNNRILNGYVVLYLPNHPKAMKSENWKGYVYEHIVVAEKDYKRSLTDDEHVHHLDLNRSNNSPHNLIILPKKSHGRLHKWLESGALTRKDEDYIPLRCVNCNSPLNNDQSLYCSLDCNNICKVSKMESFDFKEVLQKLSDFSLSKVAKEYGMSDNGLRKWLFTKKGFTKEKLKSLRKK